MGGRATLDRGQGPQERHEVAHVADGHALIGCVGQRGKVVPALWRNARHQRVGEIERPSIVRCRRRGLARYWAERTNRTAFSVRDRRRAAGDRTARGSRGRSYTRQRKRRSDRPRRRRPPRASPLGPLHRSDAGATGATRRPPPARGKPAPGPRSSSPRPAGKPPGAGRRLALKPFPTTSSCRPNAETGRPSSGASQAAHRGEFTASWRGRVRGSPRNS